MKNPDQPEWQWRAAVSEVDGRWLELYVSRDTSRVWSSVLHIFPPIEPEVEKPALACRP